MFLCIDHKRAPESKQSAECGSSCMKATGRAVSPSARLVAASLGNDQARLGVNSPVWLDGELCGLSSDGVPRRSAELGVNELSSPLVLHRLSVEK